MLFFQLFHKFEINSNQKVQNLAKENDFFFFFNEKSVRLTALSSMHRIGEKFHIQNFRV